MENGLVSVIISAYNHENYIKETIESVINQTYKKIELLVVDDGSTDQTWQKLLELRSKCESRFLRVVLERHTNVGICQTLNKLIRLARGEYCYFLDSDDVSKKNAIEKEVMHFIENEECVLAVGCNEIINSKSEKVGWDEKRNCVSLERAKYATFDSFLEYKSNVNFSSDEFGSYRTLVLGNYIPNGFLVKTEKLLSIGDFSDEAPLEDWYLMLQLSKLGKFGYIPDVLHAYRWHETNTIKNTFKMESHAYKTWLFEKKLVHQSEDANLIKIFNRRSLFRKEKVNIFGKVIVYKEVLPTKLKIILEINRSNNN